MLLHDGIGAVFLAVEHQHPGVFGQAHIAEGFFDPRHGERRRWVRNQVIEREQGVRLPAAKGGLHLGHGRRGAAAHATGNVADRLLEVLREVGVREEERRIQVFLPRRARIDPAESGGKERFVDGGRVLEGVVRLADLPPVGDLTPPPPLHMVERGSGGPGGGGVWGGGGGGGGGGGPF